MSRPVAIITGAASGIGLSLAHRWVREGGVVAVLDLDPAAVAAAVEALGPDHAFGRACDVTSDDAVRSAVDRVGAENDGVIDAVVNCAGIARPAPAATVSDRDWSALVDVHLHGAMRVNRASYEFLKRSKRGSIVNISSVAAAAGMPGRSSYCAAKAGVEGLTRALAVEWAADGIRVNAVAPGYVNSEMTAGLVESGALNIEPVLQRTPLGRLAEPGEIAAAVFFLCTPESSFVTGQTLYVDGGMTIDGNWY